MPTSMRQCRACGQPFSATAPSNPCSRCGYINLAIDNVRNKFGWLTPAHASASVELLFREKFQQAKESVAKDVAGAAALLLTAMIERESMYAGMTKPRSLIRDGKSVVFNAAVQLLYLLICQQGGVRIADFPPDGGRFSENDSLWTRLYDTALLARLRMREEAGEATFAIDGDCVAETFTDFFKIGLETQENSHRVEARFRNRHPALEEPEFFEMQRVILGYSALDFRELVAHDYAQLRKMTKVQPFASIVAADLEGLPDSARTIFGAFTLTLQRVFQFQISKLLRFGRAERGAFPCGVAYRGDRRQLDQLLPLLRGP
jgi:hypothetical protein